MNRKHKTLKAIGMLTLLVVLAGVMLQPSPALADPVEIECLIWVCGWGGVCVYAFVRILDGNEHICTLTGDDGNRCFYSCEPFLPDGFDDQSLETSQTELTLGQSIPDECSISVDGESPEIYQLQY